jgi:hypothetical protein
MRYIEHCLCWKVDYLDDRQSLNTSLRRRSGNLVTVGPKMIDERSGFWLIG